MVSDGITLCEENGLRGLVFLRGLNRLSKEQAKPSIDDNIFEYGWKSTVRFVKARLFGQRFFFALHENVPAGVVSLCPHQNKTHYSIVNYFVLEEKRDLGIGKKLVTFAVNRCEKAILVRSWSPKTRHIYEENGFKVKEERKMLIMERKPGTKRG